MNIEQPSYKNIIDQLPQMVCRFDLNMRLTFTNSAYRKWRGQSNTELLGSNIFDNVSPKQRASVYKHIENLSPQNPTAVSVHGPVSSDEEACWIEWRDSIVVDEHGEIIGYQGVGRDITQEWEIAQQLEQTKEAVRESEERYRIISELMSDSALEYRLDQDGELQHLWEWGADINERLGYSPEELEKTALPKGMGLVHPDDRTAVQTAIHQTLYEGKETSNEYRLRTKDGRYLWFLSRRKPTWNENKDQVIGFVLAIKEITPRKEAELHLLENQERYRIISELVSDYASEVKIDEHGQPTRAMWLGSDLNEELGYQDDSGFSNNLTSSLSYYHPDDRLRLQEAVKQTLAGQETMGEYRLRAKDGTYYWFSSRRKPIWNKSHDTVIGYLLALKNITTEKKAEITLRESEERYRLVSELISDSAYYFEVDESGNHQRIWSLGDQTDKSLGWPESSLKDTNGIYNIVHPDDLKALRESVRLTHEGYETTNNYRIRNTEGTYYWYAAHRRPVWNEAQDRVVGYIVAMNDITLAKQAEEALKQANQVLEERVAARTASLEKIKNQLDVIFNNSGDSILHLDETFHMIEANEACDKLFRQKRQAYLGSQFTDHISAKDITIFQQAAASIFQTHKVQQIELSFIRGLKTINIEASLSHIFDYSENSNGYILNIRDISTRKQTEQALRTALETEQEISELKTRIISVASHEFRTPLTAILATAETLMRFRSRIDEEKINNRLGKIIAQVHQLRNITEDMLQLTRLQTNNHTLDVTPHDLDTLCMEIIGIFHTQDEYAHRIDYICLANNQTALIDKQLISQAISNLVQNALKYSEQTKKVLLSIYSEEENFKIMIQDHGIGIPETDLKRLFTPFHRASNVGVISGTGLGLSIAKRAVEAHKGRILVDTELGSGTTFTIIIPKNG